MSAKIGDEYVMENIAANGEKLTIERSASQAAGVVGEPITSPAPDNPSFATNTTSWTPSTGTAITRDTGTYATSPASGLWDRGGGALSVGDSLTETFAGTFAAGVAYTLTLALRSNDAKTFLHLDFGSATDHVVVKVPNEVVFTPNVFHVVTVVWTPSAAVSSGVRLVLTVAGRTFGIGGAGTYNVDSLLLHIAKPTLVDRRGFRRTHILPVKSSLTTELGTQIGDVWLAAHKTTPFKGTARIEGDRAAREITTGASIPPEQFLLHTGELLRLADRIDPDTGGQGRDGRIAEVTYVPADDAATVTLDSRRTSHEALLERLSVVVGGG